MRPAFRSKNEIVYDVLRQSIIQGEYKPGTRLVIDELAATLGVSQIPIREAMRQLEADGFVTIEPYVGATITDITADFIYEVFALLEATEVICSRAACRSMTDEQLQALVDKIEQMEGSVHDPARWSAENTQLHLFICECAGMGLILKMTHKILDHWDRLRLHYLKDVSRSRIPIAQQEHREMLRAFRQRDPDEVERVIRIHNQNALASYIRHLQSTGQLTVEEEP
jgi:DNA-binding GntR family transcriptional regulator